MAYSENVITRERITEIEAVIRHHIRNTPVVEIDGHDLQLHLHSLAIKRVVAEPGGAAAFAALCSGSYKPKPDERVGAIVSGGNTVGVNFDRT